MAKNEFVNQCSRCNALIHPLQSSYTLLNALPSKTTHAMPVCPEIDPAYLILCEFCQEEGR